MLLPQAKLLILAIIHSTKPIKQMLFEITFPLALVIIILKSLIIKNL